MATLAELLVQIGVDAQDLKGGVDDAASSVDNSLQRIKDTGAAVTDVGRGMTAGVTTPLVGMGVAALTTAGNFESSMNNVRAVTGATGAEFNNMSDLAREMGSTTQFSASESADAMQYLGMAGLDTNEIMEALPGTLNLAAAGGLELADAADVSTNVLAGFGMEVEQLGHLNDVLAEASRSANTDVQGLGMGMKQVAPVASGLGFTLEDTTAALGFLADAGIQGEQGGTLLRSAMSSLINPTAQAGEMMEQFGIQATEADGSAKPLPDILRQMEESGMDASDMMQLFGTEAGPAMISLLERGGDELEQFSGELEGSAGAAEEMADIKMEGLQGSLKELQSAAEGLMLAIADSGLLDTVTSLTEKVTGWVQGLSDANPALLKWATIIAAVVAAIGPLLIAVGMGITAIGQIATVIKTLSGVFKIVSVATWLWNSALYANPVVWIIAGIIALIAVIVLIIVYWDEIAAATSAAWEWIKSALAAAWEWIKSTAASVWNAVVSFFSGIWNKILAAVKSIWAKVKHFIELHILAAQIIVRAAAQKIVQHINFLKSIPGRVRAFFSRMKSAAVAQIQSLLARVRAIPGKIKSAIGNLGSLLKNAGKNIIRGLINGVTSMISSLRNKFSEITGMIPDWKGPMSVDRRLLGPSGEALMDGLGSGVESGLPGLRKTLNGVTNEIPSNINTSVRHTGNGGGNRVVVDVTGADQEMVRLIRKMVRVQGRGDVQQAFGKA